MDKVIQKYRITQSELKELDDLITKVPELRDLMAQEMSELDQIINGIDSFNVSKSEKNFLKTVFSTLAQNYMKTHVYQYSNFRNQDVIENLLKREKTLVDIIKKTRNSSSIEEMNRVFSTLVIKTVDDKKLSKYMQKSLKDVKFCDDFTDLTEVIGQQTFTKQELLNMKTSRKGTNFKNIETITAINSPSTTKDAFIYKQ